MNVQLENVPGAVVIREIQCPACQTGLAYSAALLGRKVQCLHCREPIDVSTSPDGHTALAPPLPSKKNGPPPPRMAERSRAPRSQPEYSDPPVRRPAGVAALLGLLVVCFGGFLVVALGIGYLVWPRQTPTTAPATQTAVPPEERPVDVEQPKSLNDLLRENPRQPKSGR